MGQLVGVHGGLFGMRQFSNALVLGAHGGIGGALADLLEASGAQVVRISRKDQDFDITCEQNIADVMSAMGDTPYDLVFNATGFLHGDGIMPEKTLRQLSKEALTKNFETNAIGPALLLKQLSLTMPRSHEFVAVSLSARVGSISDNKLGGWYSYRSAKAAQNQLIRSAAIEFRRTHPKAILLALHPGTVASALSEPFAKSGLRVRPPQQAAQEIHSVLQALTFDDHGRFVDHEGKDIPW